MALCSVAAKVPDDCTQQPPPAECRAFFPAWYFNTVTGTCTLRHCHNMHSNRWATEEECIQHCRADEPGEGEEEEEGGEADDICSLPAEIGPCHARFSRYYFDAARNRCRRFFYGGCGGNANNFNRKSECKVACKQGRAKGRDETPDDDDGIIGPIDPQ